MNSIKADDDSVTLWGSFDYPEIALDPPFQAPYGRKAERFRLNCNDQKYSLLGGYDLDQREHVTDGAIFPSPTRERVGAANSDYRELFAAVCGSPAALKALPRYVAREKAPLPPAGAVAPAPGVFSAIDMLNLPPPRRQLKRLVLEGTHVFEGKRSPLHEVRDFKPGDKPGLVSSTETGDGYRGEELSFLGYVTIRRQLKFTKLQQEGNEAANELSFRGDWGRMPIGSKAGYTLVSRSTYTDLGTLPQHKNTSECRIIDSISAAVLHPDLKGDAKLMECRGLEDQHKQVVKVYFLQDYSYLIALESSETKFAFFSKKITSVEQN